VCLLLSTSDQTKEADPDDNIDPTQLLQKYEATIKACPDDPLLHVKLADLYMEMKQFVTINKKKLTNHSKKCENERRLIYKKSTRDRVIEFEYVCVFC
jgi:hypothetical protein